MILAGVLAQRDRLDIRGIVGAIIVNAVNAQ
jgi:hypothetical protein